MNNDQRAELDRIKAATSLAAVVSETVHLQRSGRDFVGLCPFHAEKTPSFHVFNDHYHCFGCGAHGDALTWLQKGRGMTFRGAIAHLGGAPRLPPLETLPPARAARSNRSDRVSTREQARKIWIEATDPRGTPVETYLRHRGLRLPEAPAIRFHPACPRTGGALPAMVALMTDPVTRDPRGVHRTFLLPDGRGKALVNRPKMMFGNAGVIRLVPNAEVTHGLGIGEGIETCLAIMQRSEWRPVWAAGSAGAIEKFPVLPGIDALTIFADADDSGAGKAAARICAYRWADAGREADIQIPPAGADWDDALESPPA